MTAEEIRLGARTALCQRADRAIAATLAREVRFAIKVNTFSATGNTGGLVP
jgi:hypothetical protein